MTHIIDSYSKLPVGKYIEILDLCDDDSMEEIVRQAEINAILADMTADEVMRLPIVEFKAMTQASHFLEEECPTIRRSIPKTYNLAGTILEARLDIARISTAQYVDFKTFCFDRRHNLPQILSCFLIPKGMEYNEGYDITEVHDLIREHLSVADAMNLSAFFLTRSRNLTAVMLIYLRLMTKKVKDKERRAQMLRQIREQWTSLAQNGGGSTWCAEFPRPRTNLGRLFGR